MFGALVFGFLVIGGAVQYMVARKVLRQQVEDDRKMDWWHNHYMKRAKYYMVRVACTCVDAAITHCGVLLRTARR